eukprot:672017_1
MCDAGGVTLITINSLIYVVIIVSIIWFASKSKEALGKSKFRHYMLLIYFASVVTQCIAWGVSDIFHCIDQDVYNLLGFLGGMCMGTSYLVLLLVLFGRLVHVFEGTVCQVSKPTQRLFYGILIAWQVVIGTFGISYLTQISNVIFITILVVLLFIFFVVLIVMIFHLFTSKLIHIIKMVEDQSDTVEESQKNMIHLISKKLFIIHCIDCVVYISMSRDCFAICAWERRMGFLYIRTIVSTRYYYHCVVDYFGI